MGRLLKQMPTLMVPLSPRESLTLAEGLPPALAVLVSYSPKKASPGTRTSIRPGQVATCALSARHLGAKGGARAKKRL